MRTLHFFQLLLISLFFTPYSFAITLPDFTVLAEKQGNKVVNISAIKERRGSQVREISPQEEQMQEFFRRFGIPQFPGLPNGEMPQQKQMSATGSGFIIESDGYVITNAHVVSQADTVIVKLADKREFKAKLLGVDKRTDVALLKIEAKNLPTVSVGDPEKVKVGEWVAAIGSPFGLENTMTVGIVSAKGRALPQENFVPFIQTDVAINPGNSGGPLFNLDGEVVGINSQIYTRSGGFMGLSFAIPSNTAISVVAQLRETGEVARGWLGVQIQEVSQDLAESFGLDKAAGALIAQVFENSPALAAGLQAGDVITQVDGNEIVMSAQVAHFIGAIAPEQSVVIQLVRGGESIDVNVTIGHLPKSVAGIGGAAEQGQYVKRIGLRVATLSSEKAQEWRIRNGIDILEVDAGVAKERGLKVGDVITSMANQRISSVQQFVELAATLPPQRSISLRIVREGRPLFVAFRLNQ